MSVKFLLLFAVCVLPMSWVASQETSQSPVTFDSFDEEAWEHGPSSHFASTDTTFAANLSTTPATITSPESTETLPAALTDLPATTTFDPADEEAWGNVKVTKPTILDEISTTLEQQIPTEQTTSLSATKTTKRPVQTTIKRVLSTTPRTLPTTSKRPPLSTSKTSTLYRKPLATTLSSYVEVSNTTYAPKITKVYPTTANWRTSTISYKPLASAATTPASKLLTTAKLATKESTGWAVKVYTQSLDNTPTSSSKAPTTIKYYVTRPVTTARPYYTTSRMTTSPRVQTTYPSFWHFTSQQTKLATTAKTAAVTTAPLKTNAYQTFWQFPTEPSQTTVTTTEAATTKAPVYRTITYWQSSTAEPPTFTAAPTVPITMPTTKQAQTTTEVKPPPTIEVLPIKPPPVVSVVKPTKTAGGENKQSRSVMIRNEDGSVISQKMTACDNSVIVLKCPSGIPVKINSALYGRTDEKTCLKWHHQQTDPENSYETTTLPYVTAQGPRYVNGVNLDEYRPCFRNETLKLQRQCSSHNLIPGNTGSPIVDECVVFVDQRDQFSEPYCVKPPGYVDRLAGASRYAVIEFVCSFRRQSDNATIYVEPQGYVVEKGSDKMSHSVAIRVLNKAQITLYNQQACQKEQQSKNKVANSLMGAGFSVDSDFAVSEFDKRAKGNNRQGQRNSGCVSLEGVRLKNIRLLISLRRKSNCNDIYIIGGSEVRNNDHRSSNVVDGPNVKPRKRSHQNGYRFDIAATNPSKGHNKGGSAGICISNHIRQKFKRLSPVLSDDVVLTSLSERERQQITTWKHQQKHVFNDTSENGGVIYTFVAGTVPLWDILYP